MQEVRKYIDKTPNKMVFVKGDKTIPYGDVISVVNALIEGGVKHVAMATKKSA